MAERLSTEVRPEVEAWLDDVSEVEIDGLFDDVIRPGGTIDGAEVGQSSREGAPARARWTLVLAVAILCGMGAWGFVEYRAYAEETMRTHRHEATVEATRRLESSRHFAETAAFDVAGRRSMNALIDGVHSATDRAQERNAELVMAPLPEGAIDALDDIRWDPPPEEITKGIHYVVSNEWKHFIWEPWIRRVGGIFVGVGTDQNYIMAGWARPAVLILMDFDQYIVELHHVYGAFFKHADTPEEFLALWESNNVDYAHRFIEEHYPRLGRRYIRRYDESRYKIRERLYDIVDYYDYWGYSSFLHDQADYSYLAELWRRGRVMPVRGDLTGYESMADIADYARKIGMPIRVLYTSNAQYYFDFDTENFRPNIEKMYFDERSWALHTDPYTENDYDYFAQPARNYREWVTRERVAGLRHVMYYADDDEESDLVTIDRTPSDIYD